MNRLVRAAVFLGVIVAFSASEKPAQAQYFGWPGLYGPSIYTLDRIPYFSQFPPVYYSRFVPRPYGYSPYAYPPGYVTPARSPIIQTVIDNPYASFASAPAKVVEPAEPPKPLLIKNPFVKQ